MSLMSRKTRIDAKQVAQIIGCSRKTVLNGGAGTAQLTRIRNGSKQVRFILEEVQALVQRQERLAQRHRLTPNFDPEIDGQPHTATL
jgi:predicted DNA-binding transcriptional regulator AlpA